jgi:hypothetical protein
MQVVRIGELDQANRKLQEQVAKFRDIIMKGSGQSRQVDDSTIITLFVALRQQIQNIAFQFYQVDQRPKGMKQLSQRQQEFFSLWRKKLTQPQLRNRVRAMIFELLHDWILGRRCFGLEDFNVHGDLEISLAQFEEALEKTEGKVHMCLCVFLLC